MSAVLHWVERQGGMLVAPRRTAAALGDDEGRRDGRWALVVWLLGVHTYDIVEVVARIVALRNLDGVLGGAADLAFALLAPFVTIFALELGLGTGRDHRAGTCLAPMLAVGASLRLVQTTGLWPSFPTWLPGLVGAAAAIGVALYVRSAVPVRRAVPVRPEEAS